MYITSQNASDLTSTAVSGFGNDERLREVLEVERWIFPGLPETKGPGSQVSNRSGSITGTVIIKIFYFILFCHILFHRIKLSNTKRNKQC